MGGMDTVKELCCTWKGMNRMKKVTAFVCGSLVITTAILTILSNVINVLAVVRSIWNIFFGVLMIFLQLNWQKMITRNFGFLKHWFMRATFYIFVGTNTMTWESGPNNDITGGDIFSVVVGSACIFVGVLELLFGFKCHGESEIDDEASKRAKVGESSGGVSALQVNITPAQAAQGATFLANNANTVAAVAKAAAPAAAASSGGGGGSSGGGTADNPFFGNAHLSK